MDEVIKEITKKYIINISNLLLEMVEEMSNAKRNEAEQMTSVSFVLNKLLSLHIASFVNKEGFKEYCESWYSTFLISVEETYRLLQDEDLNDNTS